MDDKIEVDGSERIWMGNKVEKVQSRILWE